MRDLAGNMKLRGINLGKTYMYLLYGGTIMKKLFTMSIIQEHDIDMGMTCNGATLISPTDGGRFEGDEMRGEIVPVGMGATYTPNPGQNDIDSLMMLKTEDGAHILMEMKAFLDIDAELEEKLMKGEAVSPDEYYFKGTVLFKTGDERYKWLERKVCVCTTEIKNWECVNTTVYLV